MSKCHSCGAQWGGGQEAGAFVRAEADSKEATETISVLSGGTPHLKGGKWLDRKEVLHGHYLCYRCMYLAPAERGKTPEEAYERWRQKFPVEAGDRMPPIDWGEVIPAIIGILLGAGVAGTILWFVWHGLMNR